MSPATMAPAMRSGGKMRGADCAPGAQALHLDEREVKLSFGGGQESGEPGKELARGHVSLEVVMGVELDRLARAHQGAQLRQGVGAHQHFVAKPPARPHHYAVLHDLGDLPRNPADHPAAPAAAPLPRRARSMWQ